MTLSEKIRLAWLVSISLAFSHQVRYFHAPTEQMCHLICWRNATSRCSDCKKVWKARATSASGIPGRVESLCWLSALNETGGHFPVKKSSVTSAISRDHRRSNTSCFLACRLVEFFFDEHYSFSDFLSKLCRFARETCQKGH